MRDWIKNLSALDSEEVAGILVMAMSFRNILRQTNNIDLMLPFLAINQEPTIAIMLNRQLQELQKEKLFSIASGAIVWLFTIRAAFEPSLRDLGRQLWRELARGFLKANESAEGLFELTGEMPDITDIGRFPDGFTPDRL